MKNKQKETGVSVISIVFYVAAVIFLGIAAFNIYRGYLTVQDYQAQYTMTLFNILSIYFSSCAEYFAYAFILYGIGVGLNRVTVLNNTLSDCLDDAQEEVKEEATIEEAK